MSIPGVPGDRSAYDVIYRAKWDGSELSEGAAKARAELEAIQKANKDLNNSQAQDARDMAQAINARTNAEKQLTRELRDQAQAMQLLNKAENNGFATPQEFYQFKDRALQQQVLLNKAENNGRDTLEQHVADIKAETAALDDKGRKISTLSTFFEDLAAAQERSNASDPFANDKGNAAKNLKSYSEQVAALINGLQGAIQNDPFANGTALKKTSLNVQAFADSIKKAINDVDKEMEKSTKTGGTSSFFSSFSSQTKDIEKGLRGISDAAKKAEQDGGKAASDLDTSWKKFKYTLDSVKGSANDLFRSGSGSGGIGGGIGSLFASGAAAGGSFLQLITAAIPALTSFWGILGMGVTIFPLIISGLLAVVSGLIGLVASLGTVMTAVGAFIPIMVALGAAALVLEEALKPVVKAVQALGQATNSSQVQAALKGLSPAAQSAAMALFTLEKAFKGTTGGLEQAFWTPLLPSLKNIGEIAKPLNSLLKSIAGSLGTVLNQALTGFEKFTQTSGFTVLIKDAENTVTQLGNAFVNVLDVITKLSVAGAPITSMITTGIDNLTIKLDKFITTAQKDGTLSSFFDSVENRMRLLGNIFSNFFGGLNHLFQDFLPIGDAFLEEIDGWAKRFDNFSNNRKALSQWAQDAIPFLKSLGDLLANIVAGIVRLGSNPQNLKDLTDIFQGLGKIVNPLFNVAQALFNLFAHFATAVAPLIGSALSGLGRILQDVANWIGDIESHRAGMDALKTVLGIFGGLVVSASLVNFVGKLITLAGSSWDSLKKFFGFFSGGGFGGGGSGPDNPAQGAADTQLRAAQINLTASENNLRAAGIMETASTENVVAGDEMGAAVVGGSGGGKSFGKGLLGALGAVGGFLALVYGNQAVNSNTAPNTGGRTAGEAGVDITGGALVGGSLGGIPGAIVGGVIGGIKAIFDNGPYLDKLLNTFNPNNRVMSTGSGPSYLTPKGTQVDPVTGLPIANLGIGTGGFNGVTITPAQLGNLSSTYNSQVPGRAYLPPVVVNQPNTRLITTSGSQPGDPRANPSFGYGNQDKPIISPHFLDPVMRFFTHDIEQWSKDAWHATQNFFTGPFVRFFTDTIPHAAGAFGKWFINQNKEIWKVIKQDGVDIWQHVFQPAWHSFDKYVYQPVADFVTKRIPNFFTQSIPHWYDSFAGVLQRNLQKPVRDFITKDIPNFFTQTIPHWYDSFAGVLQRNLQVPVRNFITKDIPNFFTQTIPHWFDNVGNWFSKSVISPISNFFTKTLPGVIEGSFKGGLNWVIDHVIGGGPNPSGGIIGFLNKAAGVVGVHIPGLPHLATGGKVPGPDYIDHDAVYAKLTPGEFVIRKKAAQHLGTDMLHWLNNADKNMPHFSGGGGVSGWLTGSKETQAAINAAKGAFGFVQGALRTGFDVGWNPLVKALLSPLGSGNVPASVGAVAAGGIKTAVDDFLGKKDKSYFGALGGAIATGIHKLLIDQALSAAGVPSTNGNWAHWETGMNTLVQRESGWNPSAINLTDSNAKAGIPSQGLAQLIPPTFAAYHVAGTSANINDPIANLAAAIRYIINRYGDISFVQQANANKPPKGYNTGGFVMPDFGSGFAMPAPVRYAASSPRQLAAMSQSLSSKSVGMNVETMNINNPIRERAGESVQRVLYKNNVYAGRG